MGVEALIQGVFLLVVAKLNYAFQYPISFSWFITMCKTLLADRPKIVNILLHSFRMSSFGDQRTVLLRNNDISKANTALLFQGSRLDRYRVAQLRCADIRYRYIDRNAKFAVFSCCQ